MKTICTCLLSALFQTLKQYLFLVQLLNSEPWEALRPTLETLLEDKNKDKQRAAAEFLAGVFGGPWAANLVVIAVFTEAFTGSKNWTLQEQDILWSWFTPRIPVILRKNIKTETLSTWKSFLEVSLNPTPSTVIAHIIRPQDGVPSQGSAPPLAASRVRSERVQRNRLQWRIIVRRLEILVPHERGLH